MERYEQLALVEPGDGRHDGDWRLDEETRETGRRGIAAARAALQEHRRPFPPRRGGPHRARRAA